MRYKRFDLNLLLVLDVLLRERNVSRAAKRLDRSQPAVSAALARLRDYFNDPILVGRGKQMMATAHAQSLSPMVSKALAEVNTLISASTVFDPTTTQRTFRICASDYVTTVLLVPLFEGLSHLAPRVKLELSAPSPKALAKLESGEIDFLLTPEQFTARDHPKKLLFEERFVALAWKRNPLFRKPLTEEAFYKHGHVAVVFDAPTFAEQELAALGSERRIEIVASSFLSVAWLLPNTLRLAVVHERLAKTLVKNFPLAYAPLPFAFPLMREMIQYHGIRKHDSGAQWLLRQIEDHAALVRMASVK